MTNDELKLILAEHAKWLSGEGGKRADLSYANLSGADLRGADLRAANLSGADLRAADLRGADLSYANLSVADLRAAGLRAADLRAANLSGADLREANLYWANLSGCTGLLSASDWMGALERSPGGWIVYKRIGETQYHAPESWQIEPGAILTEVVNPDRTCDCACGVNFGTRKWCDANYTDAVLWRCLIRWEWGPSVVVPYNTDGKARCERLQLVEVVGD